MTHCAAQPSPQLPGCHVRITGRRCTWAAGANRLVSPQKAQDYGYDQSMMARFCKLLEENVEQNAISRMPVVQLTVQYRMHPDICLFPSNYIYNKSLKTNRSGPCIPQVHCGVGVTACEEQPLSCFLSLPTHTLSNLLAG